MNKPVSCQRDDLAVIRVTGGDARAFLHAQTTQDIAALEPGGVTLAAWLSPQGRVLGLFDVICSGDEFLLVTDAGNADWLVPELSRFVLRADVTLEPAPDVDALRLIGSQESLPQDDGTREPVSINDFWRAEIAAGRPVITPELRDRYIPQMLNLDELGAISFTKGCYPGQEIVARTANLGKVKRRLRRFRSGPETAVPPGTALLDESGQTVGDVVRSCQADDGSHFLAVVSVDADASSLRLATTGGRIEPLPFTG